MAYILHINILTLELFIALIYLLCKLLTVWINDIIGAICMKYVLTDMNCNKFELKSTSYFK